MFYVRALKSIKLLVEVKQSKMDSNKTVFIAMILLCGSGDFVSFQQGSARKYHSKEGNKENKTLIRQIDSTKNVRFDLFDLMSLAQILPRIREEQI